MRRSRRKRRSFFRRTGGRMSSYGRRMGIYR